MPRKYSMDKRASATAATQQRIIEATMDEVVATGGEPVTLQRVAERADLSLRTLYNHFPNREALLSAAFSHHAARSRAAVEAVTLADADPQQQLGQLVAAYYSRYEQMGVRLSVLLALRGHPDLEEQIRAIRAWRRSVISRVVARAEEEGALRVAPATAVSFTFTLTGHATWTQLVEELGSSTRAAAATSDVLRSALLRRGRGRRPGGTKRAVGANPEGLRSG